MGKLLSVAFFVCAFAGVVEAQDLRATTDDGRKVILRLDGSWSFARDKTSNGVPASATERFVSSRQFYSIAYDPSKWRLKKSTNEDAEVMFEHKSGDAYAMAFAERLEMSQEALHNMVMTNFNKAGPDTRIVSNRMREINGVEGRVLQVTATVDSIPITYYGFYWTGKRGILQLVFYTGQNLFDEFSSDMTELMNGLQIKE